MKNCRICGLEKPLADFYKHPKASDGHDSKCKECAKSMVRTARAANADHYREFDRKRANDAKRVAARASYAATASGQEARNRARDKWEAANDNKKAAHDAVSSAVRRGKLMKQPCAICGSEKVEAHHPNYAEPLNVIWLCVPHHKELHRSLREVA
jgi:hypothetical protein